MWSYTSVRSTIRIRTVFFITNFMSVYATQLRTIGGFLSIYWFSKNSFFIVILRPNFDYSSLLSKAGITCFISYPLDPI